MKAIVYETYGTLEVLGLKEVDKPIVGDEDVLVKVHAASVNPYDWHLLTGTPYVLRTSAGLRRPKVPRLGVDFAGKVEAVGKNVEELQPGDEVFGMKDGAFGEYLTVAKSVVKKPANLNFAQAAAVPMAALTALQGLRDRGQIQADQKVLIVGASGGIGTFAIQIAKSFGAEVTGVCSSRNVELVRSLGADHIIDYTKEDYTRTGKHYDLILDTAATGSISDRRRALSPRGTYVLVGGYSPGRWLGGLKGMLRMLLARPWAGDKKMLPFLATAKKEDLVILRDLIEGGKIAPVIDRCYPLEEVPDALAHVGQEHGRGKTVITVLETS